MKKVTLLNTALHKIKMDTAKSNVKYQVVCKLRQKLRTAAAENNFNVRPLFLSVSVHDDHFEGRNCVLA